MNSELERKLKLASLIKVGDSVLIRGFQEFIDVVEIGYFDGHTKSGLPANFSYRGLENFKNSVFFNLSDIVSLKQKVIIPKAFKAKFSELLETV